MGTRISRAHVRLGTLNHMDSSTTVVNHDHLLLYIVNFNPID